VRGAVIDCRSFQRLVIGNPGCTQFRNGVFAMKQGPRPDRELLELVDEGLPFGIARTPVSQCFSEGTASGCRSCAYFRIQGTRCHDCNSYVPTMHACSGRRPVQSVGDSTVVPTTWVVTRETCLHSDFAGNCA
jgi:hypothetical protein